MKYGAIFENRVALILGLMMLAASVGAILARPTKKLSELEQTLSLEKMIPKRFGDWREEPQTHLRVVNPQTRELLDRLYSQVLSRIYVNGTGYRIMLSVAYGKDQRGALEAHKPEVCYPAQGFTLKGNHTGQLTTEFGTIPVRRLFATMGVREEQVTYWFTIGDEAVQGKMQKRLAELRYGLTGKIPDGLLFRISSLDPDELHAHEFQDRFVDELLRSLSPTQRRRLAGFGDS